MHSNIFSSAIEVGHTIKAQRKAGHSVPLNARIWTAFTFAALLVRGAVTAAAALLVFGLLSSVLCNQVLPVMAGYPAKPEGVRKDCQTFMTNLNRELHGQKPVKSQYELDAY